MLARGRFRACPRLPMSAVVETLVIAAGVSMAPRDLVCNGRNGSQ